jgi:hypothetical protein
MKALSLQQPWAWLMVNGLKNVENRRWQTRFRGPVLVHASKSWDHDSFWLTKTGRISALPAFIPEEIGKKIPACRDDYHAGGIVGMFTITDCVQWVDSPWFFGPYGFVVKDARPLPFVPLRGQLNLFEVSDNIVRQLGLDPASVLP